MHEFKRWLMGFTWMIALSKNSYHIVTPCSLSADGKKADCQNQNLYAVPQNINETITELDLSLNPRLNLTADSFVKYTKLKVLKITNLIEVSADKLDAVVDESTFLPLAELETLNLHRACYYTDFQWPPNIKSLTVDFNSFHTDLDLSNLSKLESFSAFNSNLHDVPKIHELAPVTFLQLFDNPMGKLTAESLSHYCVLTNVSLTLNVTNFTRDSICRCRRVVEWMGRQKHPKDVQYYCGDNSTVICDVMDFEEAKTNQYYCLVKHLKIRPTLAALLVSTPPQTQSPPTLLPIVIVLFVSVASIIYTIHYVASKIESTVETGELEAEEVLEGPDES